MLRSCLFFFVLSSVALTGVALAQGDRAKEKSQPEPSPLIQAEELKQALEQGRAPRILDVSGKEAYQAAHLPGAAWVDVGNWKGQSLADGGLSDETFWSAELSKAGVEIGEPVVVVGDSVTNMARACWLLHYLGATDTRLLDGGMAAWKAIGGEIQSGPAVSAATKAKVAFDSKLLTTLKGIEAINSGAEKCVVIDTRSQAEYVGQRVSGPRGGHIPGAVNLEWTNFVDEKGKFLLAKEIRKVFEKAAVDLSQPIVTHCQTGARSSVVALAAEIAGCKDVRNYYRGWSEYSGATEMPVAK